MRSSVATTHEQFNFCKLGFAADVELGHPTTPDLPQSRREFVAALTRVCGLVGL